VIFLAAGLNLFLSDLLSSTGSKVILKSFKTGLERKERDTSNGL
jgi:hypothetical protein